MKLKKKRKLDTLIFYDKRSDIKILNENAGIMTSLKPSMLSKYFSRWHFEIFF